MPPSKDKLNEQEVDVILSNIRPGDPPIAKPRARTTPNNNQLPLPVIGSKSQV